VWAIGAQSARKSTLINFIEKYVRGKITHLTEAFVVTSHPNITNLLNKIR